MSICKTRKLPYRKKRQKLAARPTTRWDELTTVR